MTVISTVTEPILKLEAKIAFEGVVAVHLVDVRASTPSR